MLKGTHKSGVIFELLD